MIILYRLKLWSKKHVSTDVMLVLTTHCDGKPIMYCIRDINPSMPLKIFFFFIIIYKIYISVNFYLDSIMVLAVACDSDLTYIGENWLRRCFPKFTR